MTRRKRRASGGGSGAGLAAALLVAAVAAPAAGAAELTCPAQIVEPLAAAATPGWQAGERPAGKAAPARKPGPHALDGIEVLNGKPGDELGASPATLAPDDETRQKGGITQIWEVKDYREGGLLLLCRYRGTATYLRAVIPDAVTRCSQTLPAGAKSSNAKGTVAMQCK